MLEFSEVDVDEIPYLYRESACSMDPEEIGKCMGEAFEAVIGFMTANGVNATGKVMSVYYTYHPEKMTFRSGFSVAADDLAKARGDIKSDVTPAGRALTFTHIGPYALLRESYGELMAYASKNNLELKPPSWEIYVNDPRVTPEADLRTDVFFPLA